MTALSAIDTPAFGVWIDSAVKHVVANAQLSQPSRRQQLDWVLDLVRTRLTQRPTDSMASLNAAKISRKPATLELATPPPAEKLLFSRKAAAYALSISVRALDYRIEAGEIKTQREGRKVMITAAELKRYARSDNPSKFK